MSHSHEPSYYEIALTNRQVMIVFVVLLVCVVAAFFSGVWVGRGQGPVATAAEIEPAPDETEDADREAAAIGELHFFSDQEDEVGEPATDSSLAKIAQEPQAQTTLLEDLGGESSESEEAAAPAPGRPAASPATETAVSAIAAAPSATVEATSGYVIQVFSSPDQAQAKKLLDQLTGSGFPAFLSPVEVGNQTMMRVRIGPYSGLKEAEAVADRIRREFKLDTWVTR